MNNPAKVVVVALAAFGAAELTQNGQPAPMNIVRMNQANDGTIIGNGMGYTHDKTHVVLGEEVEKKDDPEVSVQDIEDGLQRLIEKNVPYEEIEGIFAMIYAAADQTLVAELETLRTKLSHEDAAILQARRAMTETISQIDRKKIMTAIFQLETRQEQGVSNAA